MGGGGFNTPGYKDYMFQIIFSHTFILTRQACVCVCVYYNTDNWRWRCGEICSVYSNPLFYKTFSVCCLTFYFWRISVTAACCWTKCSLCALWAAGNVNVSVCFCVSKCLYGFISWTNGGFWERDQGCTRQDFRYKQRMTQTDTNTHSRWQAGLFSCRPINWRKPTNPIKASSMYTIAVYTF